MWRIAFFSSLLLYISCSENTSERANAILDSSFDAHGGIEAFQNLDSVSLIKTIRLFKEDGTLESETFQKQSFRLNPDYLLTIRWQQDSTRHEIIYNRLEALKKVNDSIIIDSNEVNKAMNLSLSADYVFFQPFRLEGASLEYLGSHIIRDSIETSMVAIRYANDTIGSDAWRYFFDKNSRLVAASVNHNNRISLIENLEFQIYKGILFNKHRKSYFVDSLLQKKQLRAAYYYDIIENPE